jgi:probable H4MPT-linked C1 transfer pathway protein
MPMSPQNPSLTLPAPVIGLDVGGANLKAAHTFGPARTHPFALWKHPDELPGALRALLADLPPARLLAVTMTGELCDCFETKRAGVRHILDAVASACPDLPVRVWRLDGRFVDLADAHDDPLPAAASNWLALATFAGRYAPAGPAVLVDVGSTTTDVIPLWEGVPRPGGRTDPERLRTRELVYTGVGRTPVCALAGGEVMAERFATTRDVYLLLGELPEDAGDDDTADGRPATRDYAHARLARMLGGDGVLTARADTLALARRVRSAQLGLLCAAFDRVCSTLPHHPETWVLSGSGEFLAGAALADWPGGRGSRIISLTDRLGPERSGAACAHAVAVLAREEDCDAADRYQGGGEPV